MGTFLYFLNIETYRITSYNVCYTKLLREETNHPKIYRPKDSFEVWEESFSFVQEHFGYQHYEGSCHIIPNAAVILLALIHGKGEFSRSINIANIRITSYNVCYTKLLRHRLYADTNQYKPSAGKRSTS